VRVGECRARHPSRVAR